MQEIEIEFKNLLTKAEFDRLLYRLPFPEKVDKQTNFYFETKDFALKQQHAALRIREKNGEYRLTLKEPHPNGLLETHDVLTKSEASEWLNGNCVAKEYTANQLSKLNISHNGLKYYGSLTTERREYKKDQLLYVLDYSTYNNQEDYELEIEATDEKNGLQAFHTLLQELDIPKRKTPNKIRRFFATLKK
ncbi:CYTH domain-containing protein [Ornithinibacillus salinisoli]|uniref:CYTH domain-containing protein n=1 Tax=Ornithinibacillus salinisoli TaxID=1848459 RepID=A0ABW4W1X0_9BACI